MSALREKRAWIVGTGPEADAYARALRAFPEICPRRPSIVLDADLADPPALAIVCARPHRTEQCLRLLSSGADLLVDPPLAFSATEAHGIAALAEISGRTLLTGGAERFAPIWTSVSGHLADGAIGTLQSVEWIARGKRHSDDDADLAEQVVALCVLERLAGPLDQLRLCHDPDTSPPSPRPPARESGHVPEAIGRATRLETRHVSGVAGLARIRPDVDATGPRVICRGDAGELWVGDAQIVLRAAQGARVLGPGVLAAPGHAEALAELLRRRRAPELVEDEGAHHLARAHDVALHPTTWRPA